MTQRQLERLSSIDAQFLHNESDCAHMHIGGLLIFDGAPPPFERYLEHVSERLRLVPRYRQKLVFPPLGLGRPLWVEDPNFNLAYHVRHTALPSPGSERQLLRLTARIFSQALDRTKPLWESWLVEGVAPAEPEGPERFALIFKTHHALVDGISGVDLATVMLDLEPTPPPLAVKPNPPGPPRAPAGAELLAAGARDALATGGALLERAVRASLRPGRTAARLLEAAQGIGEIIWAGLNPAPATPLNVEIGPHRRYAIARHRLADYREIKGTLGGTVNDVVLTVVAGALARWLRGRGIRTEGLELRALVPVSVRTIDQRHQLGNRLAVMRGALPVYIEDPVARLETVRRAMDGLKRSKQAVGAATLAAVESLAPPAVLAQASRLSFSTRLFNLIVTNIPGPQVPLYVLGRRLRDLLPVAFLPQRHALAVAIMSYDGQLAYGLLGDYDVLADIELIARALDGALEELLTAARAGSHTAGAGAGHAARAPEPAPLLPTSPAPAPLLPTGRARRPGRGPAADMRRRRRAGNAERSDR